jgi:transposase
MIHEKNGRCPTNWTTTGSGPAHNGVTEGINSTITTLKRLAGGYRNIDNFKTAIYFHCGGLDLHPR